MGKLRPSHRHHRQQGADTAAGNHIDPGTTASVPPRLKSSLLLRVEDLLLAGWVAIASPFLFRLGGEKGPFDSGQPFEGLLRIGAVLAVVACLAARRKVEAGSPQQPSLLNRASVGPFFGGLLLVTISGFTALGAPIGAVYAVLVLAVVAVIAIRVGVPPVGILVRRALVSPFVMVAGGLYWTLIESVVGTPVAATVRRSAAIDLRGAGPFLFFLIAFSAVYYAMLVYAPRQIAEREGGTVEWLFRYAAFVVSIGLGIGWLSILSG